MQNKPSRRDVGPVSNASPGLRATYLIYVLTERCTERRYVGLTVRTLGKRIASHVTNARRNLPVRAGGLMAAIRAALDHGQTFSAAFDASGVDSATTSAEARRLEEQWIAKLSAAYPHGFNLMPGGCSIGAIGNATEIVIPKSRGCGERRYQSISAAVADTNGMRSYMGLGPLASHTVYARRATGWPIRQCLGLDPRRESRGRRRVVVYGKEYTSFREASKGTGLDVQVLKSRLHRFLRQATDANEGMDIGYDRRGRRGRRPSLEIPWMTGETLTVGEISSRTGIARSTILLRWHRAVAAHAALGSSPQEVAGIAQRLVRENDRRNCLRLKLPTGKVLVGGHRELARLVATCQSIRVARPTRIGESGIRRRLSLLSPSERELNEVLLWAFGFIKSRPQ